MTKISPSIITYVVEAPWKLEGWEKSIYLEVSIPILINDNCISDTPFKVTIIKIKNNKFKTYTILAEGMHRAEKIMSPPLKINRMLLEISSEALKDIEPNDLIMIPLKDDQPYENYEKLKNQYHDFRRLEKDLVRI